MSIQPTLDIRNRILCTRFPEALETKSATVAYATSCIAAVITGSCQLIGHSEPQAFPDNVRFRHVHKRSLDAKIGARYTGFGRQEDRFLDLGDKFRTTIGIAAVIEGVHSDIDPGCTDHFRIRCGDREKQQISPWDIG